MTKNNDITIVMYHYVRELQRTRYPHLKARLLSEFVKQIIYLKDNYCVIGVDDLIEIIKSNGNLPANAALLTFDDGYSDHYQNVFPILSDHGLKGAFFPPVGAIKRRELLDVNRIHLLLASANNHAIFKTLKDLISSSKIEYNLQDVSVYLSKYFHSSRFDSAEVIFIKRMLQVGLPRELRKKIAIELFQHFIGVDETVIAEELYTTTEQLKIMVRSGMYIGSHGNNHYWFDSLDEKEMRHEIESSLEFLKEVGSPIDDFWIMCYPYGGYNDKTLSLLNEYNCTIGLTTNVSVANINQNSLLELPRLDTNDLPFSS